MTGRASGRIPSHRDDREVSRVDGAPLTIGAAAAGLRTGRWTAVELLEGIQERTQALDPVLHVFATRSSASARSAAEQADSDFASGIDRGPLQGIPLAIKDVIATKDAPTRAQSTLLPADFFDGHDAPAVASLRKAGAVLVGKTVTMEFALGFPDPSNDDSITRNPFDVSRWTGGSSTGMGAGTQAGFFLGGLGTDTAGSIRIPASMCGITGLRPTFGRVSTSGVVPLAWSQDTVGPMARSAADCRLLLSVLTGDSLAPDAVTRSIAGLRIGVVEQLLSPATCDYDVSTVTRDALDTLLDLGAQLIPLQLPHYEELTTASTLTMCTEAFTYHRAQLQSHWDGYAADTRASLMLGALTGSADYIQAQRVRQVVAQEVADLFSQVDVIASPTTLTQAPIIDGIDLNRIIAFITTQYWSALGTPAISVPVGFTSEGMPIGLQIAGPPACDELVLQVADAFQRVTDHHLREAPLISNVLNQNEYSDFARSESFNS